VLKRIVSTLLALPLAVILIGLSVANTTRTRLVLDPLRPEAPALAIELPLYVYLLGSLIVGVLVGGVAAWASQGRTRRIARVKAQEAMRWQAEADRLTRERDARVGSDREAAGNGGALAVQRR
jgi:uncharacterized integral membrane protein